jgi:ectoine hydroxylase-related dioxygenase (phytanoyl-CoA dioxygenase family)
MNLTNDSRCSVQHMTGVFRRPTIERIRQQFIDREASGWKAKDDREEKRVSIGAAPDDFRLDESWYELWRDVDQSVVDRLYPYHWLTYPVHIRHLRADAHLVPWHQDAAYVALMPRKHERLITCFIPLEPDPAATSTLEFARGEVPLLPHVAEGNHGAAIQGLPTNDLVRFDLDFGDALVFGDLTPHRTIPGREGLIERRSFEFRLVRPEHALPDKDYFDLKTRKFVRLGN